MLAKLESTLALLSGNMGEVMTDQQLEGLSNTPRELLGVWRIDRAPDDAYPFEKDYALAFWPTGGVSLFGSEDGVDYLYGEYLYKPAGDRKFRLMPATPEHLYVQDDLDDEYGIVSYRLRGKTLTLTIEDSGRIRLKADNLRLKADRGTVDPVSGLPSR